MFDSGLEIGLLGGASYDHQFDTRESIEREYSNPEEVFGVRTRSTRTVDLTGNLGLGARFGDEQRLELTSLWLRNTEDQASLRDFFTDNRNFSDGQGWRHYGIRYEERELWVNQAHGRHQWGPESRHLLDSWLPASALDEALPWLDGLRFEWYLSDSRVDNQLPGETGVTALTENDPVSGAVLSSSVQLAQSLVNYRFTDLEDQVDSRGWQLSWPFLAGDFRGELAGGWDYVRKAREYEQLDFQLGTTDPDAAEIAHLPLDALLADERILDPRYGFAVIASPTTARSYLAALTTEAWFAQVDVTWRDRWRLVVGARREQYIQATVPYAPLEYRGPKTSTDPEVLARGVFADDDWYPAVSLVYLGQDFWAETFQLRLGYSETAVRPDLREVSDASFRDPVTDHLVFGNPDVVPSRVKNYDLRAEWFFDSGDSFTASLFYKEIEDPIEFFQVPAGEAVFASRIVNADSAELAGVEIEWLWNLGRLHTWLDPFFFAGNLTLLDHELVAGAAADAPTSPKRGLAGASDYVANVQLGFDSPDGRHAATLVYNVFDERLYIAGRLGTPDTYEEPFHSLDLNYFFYWGEHLILNAKLRNLLDDSVTLRQGGVEVYDEERGIEGVLSLQWRL
ncbi:MAG: hypothetical protein KatS3mg124_1448 [Porticoccaceae bacterium]|nr:MAG: hypothetical protein KatS3mg124_1448 [Porticoccaceae bacterium]